MILLAFFLPVSAHSAVLTRVRAVSPAVPAVSFRAPVNASPLINGAPSSLPLTPSLAPTPSMLSLSVPAPLAPAAVPADAPRAIAAAQAVPVRIAVAAESVQSVVASGALKADAPSESSRGAADASFAALTGESFTARRGDVSLPVSASVMPALAAPSDAPAPAPSQPPAPKKKSDVLPRAVTAAVIIPAQMLLIHLGGAVFGGFVVLLSFQMLRELGAMLEKGGRPVDRTAMTLAGTAAALAVALGAPLAAVLAGSAAAVLLREMTTTRSPDRAGWTFFGAAVLGALPAFLAPLRGLPHGEALTFLAFAAAWAVDTGAYAAGKAFGRHKLAPLISPGKTWEGSIGGAAAVALTVGGFLWLAPGLLTPLQALGVVVVMGVIGQVSGLSNSMVKRAMGVKDSGTLLPGHGGALDRFDTFVLTAALLFALLA